MKTDYKIVGFLYEYTALCSGCGKPANSKEVLCHVSSTPRNPFKNIDEAMPVGWYSWHDGIYCPNCKGAK